MRPGNVRRHGHLRVSTARALAAMHSTRIPMLRHSRDGLVNSNDAARSRACCPGRLWRTKSPVWAQVKAVSIPARAVLCGFDEFTPQQTDLLESVKSAGCDWVRFVQEPETAAEIRRTALPDKAGEIRAAAVWARQRLECDGLTRIVCP